MVGTGEGGGMEGMATLVPAVCRPHNDDGRLFGGRDSNLQVLGL